MTRTWVAVLLAGAGCYLLRWLPVEMLSGRTPPSLLQKAAPLLAPIAFTVLASAAVTAHVGDGPRVIVPRLAALTVAGMVAGRGRGPGWAVLAGMASLWLLVALIG